MLSIFCFLTLDVFGGYALALIGFRLQAALFFHAPVIFGHPFEVGILACLVGGLVGCRCLFSLFCLLAQYRIPVCAFNGMRGAYSVHGAIVRDLRMGSCESGGKRGGGDYDFHLVCSWPWDCALSRCKGLRRGGVCQQRSPKKGIAR